jgi:hypothetical protein
MCGLRFVSFIFLTLVVSLVSDALADEFRIWQDVKGKFRTEAQFISLEGSKVQLKKRDGTVILVPLEKLSNADREYASGQIRPSNANGRFPRAVEELPDWLVSDCPFDVQQFWIKVPSDKNAAPLYLEALYDFVPELETYFPPEVRSERTPATKRRADRSHQLQLAWNTQPKKDVAERDAVLQEHVGAFEKLAEAQKRPDCVFEIGLDAPSYEPLMVASREVVRVAVLQVERDVERGDFAAVLRTIEITLRLSRDLRPRAPMSMQFVADAMDRVVVDDLLMRALKSPALTNNHCDALQQVLLQHAAAVRSLNPFLTGIRSDYLSKRMLLRDLQQQTGEFSETRYRKAFGITHETRADVLFTAVNGTQKAFGLGTPPPMLMALLNSILSTMKPANYEAESAVLKERYEALSAAVSQSYSARAKSLEPWIAKSTKSMSQLAEYMPSPKTPPEQAIGLVKIAIERKPLQGPHLAFLISLVGSSFEAFVGGSGTAAPEVVAMTSLEGAKALVALRRWYGTNSNRPPDIATLCRAAGLTEVPSDYFSDGPLRIVTFAADTPIQDRLQRDLKAVAGETIIYSIGSDGVDDKASRDWGYNGPGDFLFRLEIPQNAVKVTR